jgi:hypothetical protein
MTKDIFLSVGRTSTQAHEGFVSEIETYLKINGLNSRAIGRNEFSVQQPLKHVMELMNECSGTVVIAFERIHIEKGTNQRNSDKVELIKDENLPTVWNQIEAAMAYTLGHPLLVIAESGLRKEGLLETYDWYIQWVSLNKSALYTPEFTGLFLDWKKRVEKYKPKSLDVTDFDNMNVDQIIRSIQSIKQEQRSTIARTAIFKEIFGPFTNNSIDIDNLTLEQIIHSLKPSHIAAIIAFLATIGGGLFWLGTLFGK